MDARAGIRKSGSLSSVVLHSAFNDHVTQHAGDAKDETASVPRSLQGGCGLQAVVTVII